MGCAAGLLKDDEVYAEVLSQAEWRSGPIHANSQGYEVFAARLVDWLRQVKLVG